MRPSRLRPFRIAIVFAALAFAGAVAFVVTWPGFAPRTIVVSGNRIVSRDEVVARAGISRHVNLWLQNSGAIARRVETIPYVEHASVRRLPPATIDIAITERTPFAIVTGAAESVLVDKDLRVLAPADGRSDLPEFVLRRRPLPPPGTSLGDPDALTLRDDYLAMIDARVVPAVLSFDRFGGLVARLRSGVVVLFGDGSDMEKKVALVGPILSQAERGERRLASVDLRAPATPVVTYK